MRTDTSKLAKQLDIFPAGSLFAGEDKIEVSFAGEGERRLVIGRMPDAPNQRIKNVPKHRANRGIGIDEESFLGGRRLRFQFWREIHVNHGVAGSLKLKLTERWIGCRKGAWSSNIFGRTRS